MSDLRKWKSERELLLAQEFNGGFSLSSAAVANNELSVWVAPGAGDEAVVVRKVVAKATYSGAGLLTIDAEGEVMWEQDLAASGAEKEFDFGELGLAGGAGASMTVRASAATSMSSGRLWVLGQRK
jgi:hypothetical protein